MPRLTEQEQQEIIRYLEADKPLPDKYRFLLFDDKREVELVWNGKTNEVSQHRAALPDHRAGGRAARGRSRSRHAHCSIRPVSTGRAWPAAQGLDQQADLGRQQADPLRLKNGPLREEIEKQGGLKLIYIDPPFDVGADFSHGHRDWRRHLHQEAQHPRRDRLPRHLGQRGGLFIAMIYERLMLMRDLLGGGWEYLCALRLAGESVMFG